MRKASPVTHSRSANQRTKKEKAMANQVAARLAGDDYQHLYGWWWALSLLKSAVPVNCVRIEDPEAGSVDDVTVYRTPISGLPDEFFHYFFQVKYHVSQAAQYGTANLIEHKPKGTSLLQKFYATWKSLKTSRPEEPVLLHLVSNWSWNSDSNDLGSFISGEDDRLTKKFFEASSTSDAGKLRNSLRQHLDISDEELESFLRCIKFELGAGCWKSIKDRVSERMEHLGLKHDEPALKVCSGIVREWIRDGRGDMTREILEELLQRNNLYEEQPANSGTTIYLTTIQERRFTLRPDYVLDWREYFEGLPNRKGHRIRVQTDWDEKLMPALENIEIQCSHRESRLIRARGFARLSAWFGFGHVFSRVGGYTIEVQQREDELWRSDEAPDPTLKIMVEREIDLQSDAPPTSAKIQVACGISITGDLSQDVLADLAGRNRTEAVLFLRPHGGVSMNAFGHAGDVVAFVDDAKRLIREFVKLRSADQLLLYYFGPLSGACFLGQQLNAICKSIVIMEDQQPGYAETFHLLF
jgi:hypothetical protein